MIGTRLTIPACPKCKRTDRAEEEDQTGSSRRWFVCDRCGIRYPFDSASAAANK
jgi:uncharacterized protein YbaR (Trm112 family)